MKTKFMVAVAVCLIVGAVGCKAKYGCPSDGRNVGAEKLLSGDKKSMKAARKAGKFKGGSKF